MVNRGGTSSGIPDAMKMGRNRMQSDLPELHIQFASSRLRHILSGVIVCALVGRCAIAQAGAQAPYQQAQNLDQQSGLGSNSEACYLGGSGPVPGSAIRAAGMAVPQSALSQMQAADGGYAQQANANATDQPATGQTSAQMQVAMSADEISSILQQNPDVLSGVKTFLAQGFGVDPSIISDDGVYNCVRQDANFRIELTAESQGPGLLCESTRDKSYGPSSERDAACKSWKAASLAGGAEFKKSGAVRGAAE